MTKLEDMRRGDWVRWDSRNWEVTDLDTFRESADYIETQWELEPQSGDTHYLVRSRENKAGGTEEIWVCTKETAIGGIQRPMPDGKWTNFREKDLVAAPPERVRLGDAEFSYDGQSEARAEDDDGETVDKLTWDYYDQSRKRNVAIEIWKESDADYYEAYDGRVVRPSDFTPIPAPAGARRSYGSKEDAASYAIAIAFAAFFIMPVVGGGLSAADIGAEYLVALLLPIVCVGISFVMGAHRGLIYASLAGALGAAALLLKLRGLGASYWVYALCGVMAGPAIAEGASRLFGGIRPADKAAAAGNAVLFMLFIISFAHYIKAAPRPHNPGGLLVACVLPLLPALLVYFAYAYKGGSDEQA